MKKAMTLLLICLMMSAAHALPPPTMTLSQHGLNVRADWNTVDQATGYRLFYAPYPQATPINSIDMGLDTHLSVDLWAGAAFYVAIQAYNAEGSSGYSNITHFVLDKPVSPELQETFDGILNTLLTNVSYDPNAPFLPGIIALVALEGGSVWKGAVGQSNVAQAIPMQPDDKFRIGSITKTFVATLILQLMEDGQLSLDDTIDRYLPAAIVDNISVINGQSYGHTITLRQLLRHESGIYEYGDDAFGYLVSANPQKQWKPEELVQYAIDNGHPYFIPGEAGQYHYSNTGYILLGMVIETVTGKALHHVLRERIYQPLQLNNTFLDGAEEIEGGIASGYNETDEVSRFINASIFGAAGAIVSDTEDLRQFFSALMHGELFRNQTTLDTMLDFNQDDYGLGIGRIELGDVEIYAHDGGTLGFFSMVNYIPDEEALIIFAFNQGEIDNFEIESGLTLDILLLFALASELP
jgi:CubicO group peptidase (beta-lactamase class C family)